MARAVRHVTTHRSAALLLSAAILLSSSEPSLAAPNPSREQSFHIEAQPLGKALSNWAEQSGFELSWQSDGSERPDAPAVIGDFSPRKALSLLLDGTGLTGRFVGSRVVIRSKNEGRGHRAIEGESERSVGVGTDEGTAKSSREIVGEMLVTGSHIVGVAPAGSPITVLDQDEIQSGRYASLEQVLQSLTQSVPGGASGASAVARLSPGPVATTNITFAEGYDLRGLGPTATLTMINGQRVTASGHGYVTDLSAIPLAAVKRVEVLTDGASALYGADAIAGVVNVVLIDRFERATSNVWYRFTAPDGRNELSLSHTLGADWDTGGFVAVGSHREQTQLSVDERSRTKSVPQPESILPSNQQTSLHIAGHQRFGDAWALQADAQIGDTHRFAQGTATPSPGHLAFQIASDRTNVSASLDYGGWPGWSAALKGHLSREDTDFSFLQFRPGSSIPEETGSEAQHLTQDQWIAGATANGRLGRTSAGDVRLALGAEHREEAYTRRLRAPVIGRKHISREVDSAYIEMYALISSDLSQAPGAGTMKLSLAGRYDDYSDFGDIINPRFGISWTPVSGIEIRGTLSRSFRTPAMGTELMMASEGTVPSVPLYSFRTADGTDTVPVAFLTGSGNLQPEKARHWTAGLTLTPSLMEGWKFDLTYYSILFTGRIVGPPLDRGALSNPALQGFIRHYDSAEELEAALQIETAGNLKFVDGTGAEFGGGAFGGNPSRLATYVFDARFTNASIMDTDGWDVGATYTGELRGGELELALNASYISEFETTYAAGAPVVNTVGTVGNPAGLRLSGSGAFSRGGWHASLSLNFTRDYKDIASNSRVGSYLTADALLSYTFHKQRARVLENVSIRFGIKNLWNEPPPYIVGSLATRGANFDSANADPLGRFLSLGISKDW